MDGASFNNQLHQIYTRYVLLRTMLVMEHRIAFKFLPLGLISQSQKTMQLSLFT